MYFREESLRPGTPAPLLLQPLSSPSSRSPTRRRPQFWRGRQLQVLRIADRQDGRFYIFDPTELHQCVNASLATAAAADQTQNASFIIESLLDNMVKQYPDAHLLTDYTDHHEWVFNNAGGAMGAMYIIHASITE